MLCSTIKFIQKLKIIIIIITENLNTLKSIDKGIVIAFPKIFRPVPLTILLSKYSFKYDERTLKSNGSSILPPYIAVSKRPWMYSHWIFFSTWKKNAYQLNHQKISKYTFYYDFTYQIYYQNVYGGGRNFGLMEK